MTDDDALADFEAYSRALLTPDPPVPGLPEVVQLSHWTRAHATAGNRRSERSAADAEPSEAIIRARVLALLRTGPQTTGSIKDAFPSSADPLRRRRDLDKPEYGGYDIEMVHRRGEGGNLWILHEPPRPPELRRDRDTG